MLTFTDREKRILIRKVKESTSKRHLKKLIPKIMQKRLHAVNADLILAVVWVVYGKNVIRIDAQNYLNLCENRRSPNTSLSWVYNLKQRLTKVTSFLPDNVPITQRLWHVSRRIKRVPICKHPDCENRPSFSVSAFALTYSTYCCLSCAHSDEEMKEKKRATSMAHYGVDNPAKAEETKAKSRKTNLERRGVEYNLQCEDNKAKSRKTMMENLGVEYALQSEVVKRKNRATNMKRRGVENPFQCELAKAKSKATNMREYGKSHPTKTKAVRVKFLATMRAVYGKPHALQNPELLHRQQVSAYAIKYITIDGKTFPYQGYEHHALLHLAETYDVSQIHTGALNVPTFPYEFQSETPTYLPDMLLERKSNWIIEIKSEYTLLGTNDTYFEKVQAKAKGVIDSDYRFLLWVLDREGYCIREFEDDEILKYTRDDLIKIGLN